MEKWILMFALLLVIGCKQKKENISVIKDVCIDSTRICYVQKPNEPTALCFIYEYREKELYIDIFDKTLAVDYNIWLKTNRKNRSPVREVKYPYGEEALWQLDTCIQYISKIYPIKSLKRITSFTDFIADYDLLDAKKIDYHSFTYYDDYCHAVDGALIKAPLHEKMNKLLYKYGLIIDTIIATDSNGRKYGIASKKDIKKKCYIHKHTFIPDCVLITPITIYIKQRK